MRNNLPMERGMHRKMLVPCEVGRKQETTSNADLSLSMLLGMLERGMQIDEIIFCDTGLEFPDMYQHIDKIERDIGRHITRLKPEHSFEYYMFEKPIKRTATSTVITKYGGNEYGFGWAGPKMRWCTDRLKGKPSAKYLRQLRQKYNVIYYIGIATDEQYRLGRKSNRAKNQRHPLIDWGMTEAQCLEYCYQRGYDWNGLYKLFKRVSCWCCPLQPISELRTLFYHYPALWAKLKEWDKQTWRKFRADYSVVQLEQRFNFEYERLTTGQSIKGTEFYKKLKEKLREHQTYNS